MLLPLILYKLLKPVNKTIAALMVIFALVCVPISMLNELNHFAALLLSSGAGYLAAFKADQLNALAMFFLDLRKYGTFIAQFFSFWVLLLGYLVFKSGFLPRILGILLMLAGLSYTILAVLFFLFPNFDEMIPDIPGYDDDYWDYAANTLEAAKEIYVFITGGFHSKYLSKEFRLSNNSYITIIPNVTKPASLPDSYRILRNKIYQG